MSTPETKHTLVYQSMSHLKNIYQRSHVITLLFNHRAHFHIPNGFRDLRCHQCCDADPVVMVQDVFLCLVCHICSAVADTTFPSLLAVSSLVFFVVIMVLLSIIYRKDPQCCKLRSYQGPRSDMVRLGTLVVVVGGCFCAEFSFSRVTCLFSCRAMTERE